jgi:ABC-type spermidine/putrescine transport system permease subunit I
MTLEYYQEVIRTPAYLKILVNTFRISATVMVVTCLLGYPLAYWISRLTSLGKIIAITLVILPFWTSILVRTYAWIIILGNKGVVNEAMLDLGLIGSPLQLVFNETGVIIGMVHVLMPFLVLPLLATMIGLDNRLLLAAKSLGARPWTVFWRIYLPLTAPALSAGAVLVFILSLGFYVTPALLGGGKAPMIATVLDTLINRLPRWEIASVLSIILLICCLALFALYRRFGGVMK